jgi:predicted DsbA family dithiol-disulfide isomerase
MMTVQLRFYTDPACPWSWNAEPALRRVMWEFEDEVEFVWVMGGLARSYAHADLFEIVSIWLEDSDAGGMPCDPRIWKKNPLESTYPACRAAKAATEQGPDAAYRYLRTLREGIMYELRKLDDDDSLIEAAERAGLDRERFATDLRSPASEEAFETDLVEVRDPPQEAREVDAIHRDAKGRERISFPSALFIGDGGRRGVWGGDAADVDKLRDAALKVGAKRANDGALEPLDAVERFGTCATRELEILSDRARPELEAELWTLARDGKLKPIQVLTGTLWQPA